MSRLGKVAAGFVITIPLLGIVEDSAMAIGLVASDGLDHSATVPVSGLLSGTAGPSQGFVYVRTHLDAITGDEIRVPPQDTRGHATSFLSPRREVKNVPQRNALKTRI